MIRDLACRAITGRMWSDFESTVKGDYIPSVDLARHGTRTAEEFAADFECRFGRRPHLYGVAPE